MHEYRYIEYSTYTKQNEERNTDRSRAQLLGNWFILHRIVFLFLFLFYCSLTAVVWLLTFFSILCVYCLKTSLLIMRFRMHSHTIYFWINWRRLNCFIFYIFVYFKYELNIYWINISSIDIGCDNKVTFTPPGQNKQFKTNFT